MAFLVEMSVDGTGMMIYPSDLRVLEHTVVLHFSKKSDPRDTKFFRSALSIPVKLFECFQDDFFFDQSDILF